MCKVDLKVFRDEDLTVITASGALTAERIFAELKSFYASGVTRFILWDVRQVEGTPIGADELRRVAEFTKHKMPDRPSGKTALVAGTQANFGLCRMFEILQDATGSTVEHATFKTIEEAYTWLGVRPPG